MNLSTEVLSQLIIYSKYAKFIPELERRETWDEIVMRNQMMHMKKYPDLVTEIDSAYDFVREKKVLPSMRSLQFAGKPIELSPARLYNCLTKDTEFVTKLGVKTFEDFSSGDEIEVLTHTGNWRKAVVKSYGKQKFNKIKITRGNHKKTIYATENHRWILANGEIVDNLTEGDQLLSAPSSFNEFVFENSLPDEQLYWAYGYVFGDGTCVKYNGKYSYSMVRLCASSRKFLSRFEDLGFKSSSSMSIKGDSIVYTGSYLKTPPDPSKDEPRLIRAFVAGYLDADGGKVSDSTMVSKYRSIVATGDSHQYVVEKLFPVAGVYISSSRDISKRVTNLGTRGDSKEYGITTCISSRTPNMRFIVSSIEHNVLYEEAWCLEVEIDKSFVLPNGLVTGNCCYLPMDHFLSFSELMFLLLSGTGVGYSVQRHHINQLPEVRRSYRTRRYLIGDSIEGWADSVKALVRSYLDNRPSPIFDFSDIRPKGARLKTAGGKAPGPDPLRNCLDLVRGVFERKADGQKLTSIDVHDINCHIADAVLSGGIRRSSMISLFDVNDQAMLSCKSGSWWEENPQRALANNSAVVVRHKATRELFDKIWGLSKDSNAGEPGIFFTNDKSWGLNPCAEISLRPYQFCNLVTINASSVESQEDLNERAKKAAFIATLQAGYTDFHYLRETWKKTTEKEALIGVSLTGIANSEFLKFNLSESSNVVKEENKRVAHLIGINQAARTTTVKPEGTTSLVLGSSSGIHAWHSKFYVRRMRVLKNEPIYYYIRDYHPELLEDDISKPDLQSIICIPIKAPEGAITREESALDLLNRVGHVWKDWVKGGHRKGDNVNNVSTTVNIKENEWDEVADWMWEHKNEFTALSVLPHDGGTYTQAPFEEISEETYLKMISRMSKINTKLIREFDDSTELKSEVACGAGACEVAAV